MNHLTMEQLLALREPGLEPGFEAARAHLDECDACRAEADRLDQRVARLRALPTPRPTRSGFREARARYVAQRRWRRAGMVVGSGLALAASVALAVVIRPATTTDSAAAAVEIASTDGADLEGLMLRSQELESLLREYDPDSRIVDSRTAGIALRIEDQLGVLDRELEMLGAVGRSDADIASERTRLWRERVGLLDALMDVHLTRATYAGM